MLEQVPRRLHGVGIPRGRRFNRPAARVIVRLIPLFQFRDPDSRRGDDEMPVWGAPAYRQRLANIPCSAPDCGQTARKRRRGSRTPARSQAALLNPRPEGNHRRRHAQSVDHRAGVTNSEAVNPSGPTNVHGPRLNVREYGAGSGLRVIQGDLSKTTSPAPRGHVIKSKRWLSTQRRGRGMSPMR